MQSKNTASSPSDPFARRHRSFFVGLFLVIPLMLIPVLIIYTLMKSEFMQRWCQVNVFYDNSYGLKKGSQVSISGISVGYVQTVILEKEKRIRVQFRVNRQYSGLVKKDTHVKLTQKSFVVGDWQLELTGGSDSSRQIKDGDTLISECPFRLEETIDQITGIVNTFDLALRDILHGRGSVGKLLTDDTLVVTLENVAGNLQTLTANSRSTMQKVDLLLTSLTKTSDEGKFLIDSMTLAVVKVKDALSDAQGIVKNLNSASGDISPMVKQAQSDIKEAETIMRDLQESWLFKKISGKRQDPVLKDNP